MGAPFFMYVGQLGPPPPWRFPPPTPSITCRPPAVAFHFDLAMSERAIAVCLSSFFRADGFAGSQIPFDLLLLRAGRKSSEEPQEASAF